MFTSPWPLPALRARSVAPHALASLLTLATACNGPRRVQENAILVTGDRVATADSAILAAREREAESQRVLRERQDAIAIDASATCAPAICAAIGRGELVLGMSEAHVMAATHTSAAAWTVRRSGASVVMSPSSLDALPRDANGSVALVQLADGRAASISWRDRTGLRVVQSPADTAAGVRTRALGDALIREGDDFVAAGDRTRALERYDRALILRNDDALLNYKVAQLLDQQLRPVEAVMRYQKFLQQLELQRIDAIGTQNAKLAEAIALAQQRIMVLDRRER
jgi:hypothetical protein